MNGTNSNTINNMYNSTTTNPTSPINSQMLLKPNSQILSPQF